MKGCFLPAVQVLQVIVYTGMSAHRCAHSGVKLSPQRRRSTLQSSARVGSHHRTLVSGKLPGRFRIGCVRHTLLLFQLLQANAVHFGNGSCSVALAEHFLVVLSSISCNISK